VLGHRRFPLGQLHIVKETTHILAQRIINDDDRLAAATAMGFRRVQHDGEPPVIDGVVPLGGLRENAVEVGSIIGNSIAHPLILVRVIRLPQR